MPAGRPTDTIILEALPEELTWADRPSKEDLTALPACPAAYLLLADAKVPVQLATTQHLRRLAISRLVEPAETSGGRPDLAAVVRGIRWRPVSSAFEGRCWYYRLARHMYPRDYRRLLSFGPAWFLRADWTERVPEISISERIWQESGEFVGPWVTRAGCQKALEGLWDLFDLCRYPEQVQRAPHGQRCAYADMGRCDAPCDGSVPMEHYEARCRAAWAFACGGVRPWIGQATRWMKAAAGEQQFELAAQIKQQIAFACYWFDKWAATIRPAEQLNYLLAVPVTRRAAWKLFLFRQGALDEGPVLSERQLPTVACEWLQEHLTAPLAMPEAGVCMEQTWLLAHFLPSKEGDASIIVPLPNLAPPPGLSDRLRQAVEARQATATPESVCDGALQAEAGPVDLAAEDPGKSD
jgi:DNA polymerase-3 subunit epsilon